MKIAQVVCTLPPYGGGIGVVAYHYARNLTLKGHEVTVYIPKSTKSVQKIDYEYQVKQLCPVLKSGNAAILPQLFWKLWKYDIVHLHFPFFGAAFFVFLLKMIRGKKMKLVSNYHMDVIGAGVKKSFFSFYNKYLLNCVVKFSDKIIVSSIDYIENSNLREYYHKQPDKFIAIPFGVDERYMPQKKNPSLMSKYCFSSLDKIIGFVGGLDSAHYFKGVNYLITAISKINDQNIKLLIVGEGNLKKKYIEQAKLLGVESRVIFTGYVPNEILPEHYNLFDVFVLPSVDKSESFGLVLLEAMACGKPLVASNLKGVRSVVIPGENGLLVEPKNAQDIVDKVMHILKDKRLYEQFGLNGVRLTEEKYRWSVVVDHVLEVYNKI
ncbi:hypothetical protein A2533_05145 [Candidatus Falkowbacteria bacterium RIFOXYD2_FULL_35_9]|uniref:Glycosyl transferase family 1 domain-containing protein n=1 Tax=Candidatus Falkowbacteria bacterium RIFOXYC2_FULL_36_12 TaxID=1798002 RepID=A0A1F5T1M0_9BACT|nr:MAG: hypothetical protein A2300_03515 [Candidatus Falkowbacteria bacterium RIFOXYB2_FULL_35_7]OGF32361.1 MAG: hypothetical protein A2478_03510 [Candidatus Falkowbacteria bacterium RIFOXYC2_FULL_36_12]OGF33256.1 MAG: hypothetical protein A2223_03990 [Candidatus Falkowbacteria bacterium RIFOXYA2_FULL_35_8]OGF46475.1 MAG: hypothetical protein A2533_05145 [Candidatus Falkowbacteria bacterium RIFOXYD2_FULL_35_9]